MNGDLRWSPPESSALICVHLLLKVFLRVEAQLSGQPKLGDHGKMIGQL